MNSDNKIVRNILIFLGALLLIWLAYVIIDNNKPLPTKNKIEEIKKSNPELSERKYKYSKDNVEINRSIFYDKNKIVKYDLQYSEVKIAESNTAGFKESLIMRLEDYNKSLKGKTGIEHTFTTEDDIITETILYDFNKVNIKELVISKEYPYQGNPTDGIKLDILDKILKEKSYSEIK